VHISIQLPSINICAAALRQNFLILPFRSSFGNPGSSIKARAVWARRGHYHSRIVQCPDSEARGRYWGLRRTPLWNLRVWTGGGVLRWNVDSQSPQLRADIGFDTMGDTLNLEASFDQTSR